MAKARGRTRPETTSAKGLRDDAKAEAILATLLRYHELGKEALRGRDEALKDRPKGARYEGETIRRIAGRQGVKDDLIRKARRFAELYNDEGFAALCKQRRRGGLPLTWWSVCILIQVADKAKRDKLQRRAVEQGWSARQLQDAVIAQRGEKKSGGGRRVTVPSRPGKALDRLAEECEGWVRRCRDILGEGKPRRGAAKGRPLAKLLEAGGEALQNLGDEIEAARRQMAAVESLARRTRAKLDAAARKQGARIGGADAGAAGASPRRRAAASGGKRRRGSS